MNARRYLIILLILTLVILATTAVAQDDELTPMEQVGKMLYFDENLSANENQSCASCHDPAWGFAGPDSAINEHGAVYPGSFPDLFGNRRPPTAAYAFASPVFYYDDVEELFIGGMFWDGRATGEKLGHPLADQAQGPFLNPLEQALPDEAALCQKVLESDYAALFADVWGSLACDSLDDVQAVYGQIGLSIAEYEASAEVNPFTSKYDYVLRDEAKLNKNELAGLELFEGKAMCSACHISEEGPNGEPPMFTDFTYDNLGVPRNPENPFYENAEANPVGYDWIDQGLGKFLLLSGNVDWVEMADENMGKHKVPTLRNVDMRPDEDAVKGFTHNGYLKTLYQVVHFYNTRDAKEACESEWVISARAMASDCWPAPEVAENVNTDELGNLGLSFKEEQAIVAFLRTLTDGYVPDEE